MSLIPWRKLKTWSCLRCGACCRHTTVQLTTQEWLKMTKLYGFRIVDQGISGFYLRKTINDQCPFLFDSAKGMSCGLQRLKPLACKLWPFRIRGTPRFGKANEAYLNFKREEFYIYAHPQCPGIIYGKPSQIFRYRILPEFLDIRLGLSKKQVYSTSKFFTTFHSDV